MTITKFQSDLPNGKERQIARQKWHHQAILEVQQRGIPAALEFVDTMAGVSRRKGIARDLVRECRRLQMEGDKFYEMSWCFLDEEGQYRFSGTQRGVIYTQLAVKE